jgi:hypothetical protein
MDTVLIRLPKGVTNNFIEYTPGVFARLSTLVDSVSSVKDVPGTTITFMTMAVFQDDPARQRPAQLRGRGRGRGRARSGQRQAHANTTARCSSSSSPDAAISRGGFRCARGPQPLWHGRPAFAEGAAKRTAAPWDIVRPPARRSTTSHLDDSARTPP